MLRRFAVSNAYVFAAGLSLLVATGCEQNQQMQTWNSPQWGSWNLFGAGTQTTNYNLQYPIGNTDVLNPAAAASINTNTKSNSFSRKRNLQYAVGPTLPAKQGAGGGFTSWFGKRGPNTQPQPTAPRYNAT
ncbi:MAG: hypothetical protein KDA33_00810, partial [Phycisphaerales bacterium]|nr:hypothetical protein [Phycisphaerales bacterium]